MNAALLKFGLAFINQFISYCFHPGHIRHELSLYPLYLGCLLGSAIPGPWFSVSLLTLKNLTAHK